MTTEELKAALERAENEVARLVQEYHTSILSDHGIALGTTIVEDYRGNKYLAAKLENVWPKKPWLQGLKIKPDGTVTKQLRNIYGDWEIVK